MIDKPTRWERDWLMMSSTLSRLLSFSSLVVAVIGIGCNDVGSGEPPVTDDSSLIHLHGILSDAANSPITFRVIANGLELARFESDEHGDAYISSSLLANGAVLSAAAPGHGPAYTQIASSELSDKYAFLLDQLETLDEGSADIMPTASMADASDPLSLSLKMLDADLEPGADTNGRSVISMRYFEGPQATLLAIAPSVPPVSPEVTAVAFDGTTLKTLWTQEANLESEDGLAVLDVSEISPHFAAGVWIALIGETGPDELEARNHTTAVSDCTSNPRICAQKSQYIFGVNLCGAGSAKLTLATSKSVSASVSYMGVSVSASASVSKGFEYTFPANTRQDAYLDIRTCNYRTCGWTHCTTSSSFASCGSGGWAGCANYGSGWYAISGAKKCSRDRFSIHSFGC